MLAPPDCGGRWWVTACGHLLICIMRLCAMLGLLGLVDSWVGESSWCPIAVVVAVARHHRRWWVVVRSPHELGITSFCATLRLSPIGSGRGMLLVHLNGGRGRRWVVAHGHLVVNTARLCTTSRPLGLVDSGSGGCNWWPPIAVIVVTHCHGCWWVMARSPRKLCVARFCMTPGLSQVDNGGGGGTRCPPIMVVVVVALRRCGCRWVVSRLLHILSVTRFCATWGSSLGVGGQQRGVHAPDR